MGDNRLKSLAQSWRNLALGYEIRGLKGKNLACWCRIGQPCHADLLLMLANRRKAPLDITAFLARYGWAIERGEAVKLQGQTSGDD